jgi:16S rRNA (uracil1498-N3)-methyltransferase
VEVGKSNFLLEVRNRHELLGESRNSISMAIGILDSRDRFEFALEKSVELGACEFIPMICDRSQWLRLNPERMRAKAISALCQCKRSLLPELPPATKLADILSDNKYKSIILADEDGSAPSTSAIEFPALIIIGPEGGLSDAEINLIKSDSRTVAWNLGSRRLRAETAAIATLSLLSSAEIK